MAPSTMMVLIVGFGQVGPAFIISTLIAGIIVALFATSISELSTSIPKAGSMGEYARSAFGPRAGCWQGLVYTFVFIGMAGDAMISGMIVNIFYPVMDWKIWSLIILAIFYVINLFGIQLMALAQSIVAAVFVGIFSIGAIVQFAGGGITPVNFSVFSNFVPNGWNPVLAWALMSVWLFAMIEVPAALVEEIKRPSRVVPLAMYGALVIIFVMQGLFGESTIGTVSPETIAASQYPMVDVGQAFFGYAGLVLFAAANLAAGFGTFNAVMAGTSRVFWGLGNNGYLGKKFIGYLHPKYRTPWVTLSIIFVITVILTLAFNSPLWIISIATMLFVVTYAAISVYLIVLRHTRPNMHRPFYAGGPFKFPVLPILGIIGTIVILAYSVMSDMSILYAGGGFVVGAAIVSILVWQFYAKKQFAVKKPAAEPVAEP